MDVNAVLFDRTRYLLVIAAGILFAVSGALSILLSGDDLYALAVGIIFFLLGVATIVFGERIEGNI